MANQITRRELVKGAGAAGLFALLGKLSGVVLQRAKGRRIVGKDASISFSPDGEHWIDLGEELDTGTELNLEDFDDITFTIDWSPRTTFCAPGVMSGDGLSPGTAFGTIQEAIEAAGTDGLVVMTDPTQGDRNA